MSTLLDQDLLTEEELGMAIEEVKRPRILVGITNYADFEHLDMLLQSIRWYTYCKEKFEIFVVDDGTRHMTFENAQRRGIDPVAMADAAMQVCCRYGATYMEHEENLGIPSAWNSLCHKAHAGTEIIVLLNNDILMVPNWLKVIVHFLDANKGNPNVGSCYFNPIQPFPKADMKAILPNLAHTLYETRDQLTGKLNMADQVSASGVSRLESGEGAGQGLGRVMCPCGCCFAFRKEVFDEIGDFDTRLTSFHEECSASDRKLVVQSPIGDIHIIAAKDLFNKLTSSFPMEEKDGKQYVYPKGWKTLSAEVDQSEQAIYDHYLTPKQRQALDDGAAQGAAAQARAQAIKKLENPELHINVGVWDEIYYMVQKTTTKPLLSVRNKMGATVVTPDHSLMKYDNGELVESRAGDHGDAPLERVWTMPELEGIDSIDLVSFLEDLEWVSYDEEYFWDQKKPDDKILRSVFVGTPEMDALCVLLGGHIAEGSITYDADAGIPRGVVLCCEADRDWVEKAEKAWLSLSCIKPRISLSKKVRKKHHKPIYSCAVKSALAGILFQRMTGRRSEDKRIPNFVFRLPEEERSILWERMKEGDGFRPKVQGYYYRSELAMENYFLYTTTSHGLACDLSVLLTQFGIKFTMGKRQFANPKWRDAYWIRSAVKFYGPRSWTPTITEVKPEGVEEYVYDLGAENTNMFVDAEGLILLHNSDWGTRCASRGRASFGFAYPRPYHAHGFTFGASPELQADHRMKASRKLYRQIWGVPEPVGPHEYFNYTNSRYMSKIPPVTVKFLQPTYPPDAPPEKNELAGGELVLTPHLTEVEATYDYIAPVSA